MNIQCPVCGKFQEVAEGRQSCFCMYCGTKMSFAAGTLTEQNPAEEAAPVSETAEIFGGAAEEMPAQAAPEEETEDLLQLSEETEEAEESEAAEEPEEAAPPARKKKSKKGLLFALLAVLVLAGAGISLYFFVLKPSSEYKQAVAFMEQGEYVDAIDGFTRLGGYKDSPQQLLECYLQKAVQELKSDKVERSLKTLKNLEGTEKDLTPYREAATDKVEAAISAGDFVTALALLSDLKDYTGPLDNAFAAAFRKVLAESGAAQAKTLLQSISPFLEDTSFLNEALKEKAGTLITSGQIGNLRSLIQTFPEAEKEALSQIRSYFDECMAQNRFEEAAKLLAFFSDRAPEELQEYSEVVSERLKKEVEEKNDETAQAIIDKLGKAVIMQPIMDKILPEVMEKIVAEQDWDRVDGLEAYEAYFNSKTGAALEEYLLKLLDEKKYEEVLEIVDHFHAGFVSPNSPRYIIAGLYMEEKNYDRAYEIYTMLGDYSDSAELAKEARYQKALMLLEEGKKEEAEAIFTELGDYGESAGYIKQMRYDEAIALMQAEKYDEALAAFEALGEYSDSQDQIKEIHYIQACAFLGEEKYEEAGTLFAELEDYKDSETLLMDAAYGFLQQQAQREDLTPEQFSYMNDAYIMLSEFKNVSAERKALLEKLMDLCFDTAEDKQSYAVLFGTMTLDDTLKAELYQKLLRDAPTLLKVSDDGKIESTSRALLYNVSAMENALNNGSEEGTAFSDLLTWLRGESEGFSKNSLRVLFPLREEMKTICGTDSNLFIFLLGTWVDESGKEMLFLSSNEGEASRFNLPAEEAEGYLATSKGGLILTGEDGTELLRLCDIEIVDYDTILVHNAKDKKDYRLTRQEG